MTTRKEPAVKLGAIPLATLLALAAVLIAAVIALAMIQGVT